MKDDEQGKFDNMPESLQNAEGGEKMQSAISALEDAASSIDAAVESIQTAED